MFTCIRRELAEKRNRASWEVQYFKNLPCGWYLNPVNATAIRGQRILGFLSGWKGWPSFFISIRETLANQGHVSMSCIQNSVFILHTGSCRALWKVYNSCSQMHVKLNYEKICEWKFWSHSPSTAPWLRRMRGWWDCAGEPQHPPVPSGSVGGPLPVWWEEYLQK